MGLPTNAPGKPVLVRDLSADAKVDAVTSSSRLKYPLPPFAGMGGLKFTSPESSLGEMLVNVTPGPSYPVGPKGQPAGWGVTSHRPSPSKPKMSKPGALRCRTDRGVGPSFWTPTSESSEAS